jgi:methylphosphotriester-DNA--protein-cysteine methyltransferase
MTPRAALVNAPVGVLAAAKRLPRHERSGHSHEHQVAQADLAGVPAQPWPLLDSRPRTIEEAHALILRLLARIEQQDRRIAELEPCRASSVDPAVGDVKAQHPLVREAARLLLCKPSLSFGELAAHLHVCRAHLTRTFKRCANISIVDYRNELRLAQFLGQVNQKPVLVAALDAGFGSYVQFNRVFRARFGKPPREYLFERRITPAVDIG